MKQSSLDLNLSIKKTRKQELLAPRVRQQPLQVVDLLEVATLNCHYSSVI